VVVGSVRTMNWDWLGPTIALVAALFTGWQAFEARRARSDAKRSATEAEAHERRAVEADERIAAAMEEMAARARHEHEDRAKYRNPWTMIPQYVKSGKSYKFHLGGDETVSDVRIEIDDHHMRTSKFRFVKPDTETMRPGESMTLNWWQSMAAAPQITAELHWQRPNGEKHHSVMTLD